MIVYTDTPPVSTYNISYVLNGGTNASSNPATYDDDKAVTLANPTRTGYTFGGWYDNASFSGSPVTSIPKGSSGDKTLYAKWISEDDFEQKGDTYTIKTETGWEIFCDCLQDNDTYNRFSGKTVLLDKDITVTEMAGDNTHAFEGVFDGQGNTLTFSGTATDNYVAPFANLNGTESSHASISNLKVKTTVKANGYRHIAGLVAVHSGYVDITNCTADVNLSSKVGSANPSDLYPAGLVSQSNGNLTVKGCKVTGSISTNGKYAAGFVGIAQNTVNIENSVSSVTINSSTNIYNANDGTYSKDGTHGGFAAIQSTGTKITIKGCVFNGKLLSNNGTTNCAGFVGWRNGTVNLENCIYAPDEVESNETEITSGAAFVRNGSAGTNCYYTRTLGTAQGKAAHTITAGKNVTIGYGTATNTYDVSGITAYSTGLAYNGNFYAGNEDVVSLTLGNTAPDGYSFKEYTVNAGTLADGTLTMPDADVTVSAEFEKAQEPVTYIGADGTEQTLNQGEYTVLTGEEDELAAGWYVVNSNISYDHTLKLEGKYGTTSPVNIIICDGCTMNIGTESKPIDDNCIYNYYATLNLYGQSKGTGTLNAYSCVDSSNAVCIKNLTVNGGKLNINATKYNAIKISNSGSMTVNRGEVNAITSSNFQIGIYLYDGSNLTVNGGSLTVQGTYGIKSGGSGTKNVYFNGGSLVALGDYWGIDFFNVTLDSANATDSFKASSIRWINVTVAEGKYFTDGENIYSGTLTDEQEKALAGKNLVPANAVNIADGIENGTVTADKAAVAKSAKGDERTVTLTVTPDEGYAVKSVTVGGTAATKVDDTHYSFTMPSGDVEVSAEFEMIKTEVIINSVDINGNSTSTTVYAETYTSADYTVPSALYIDGYNFKGWTVNGTLYTSADEVQSAVETLVKAGTDVTVTVDYEKKNDKFDVTVTGGKLSSGKTSDNIQVSTLVTVKVGTKAGKKFSYWKRNGVKVSCNASYSFYMPSYAVELEAVFVDDTAAVEEVGTAMIESVTPNKSTDKVVFVSVVNVPKNCTMVKGGLVATSDSTIGVNVTADNAAFVKISSKTNAKTKNLKYTWTKSGVTESTVWYVRSYLVYKDSKGVEHTVYSNAVKANINGIING